MSVSSSSTESSPLRALRYAVGTDVGRRREENQDSFGVMDDPDLKFYIVADGMGGAKGGGTASNKAIATVTAGLRNAPEFGPQQIISAVKDANASIFEQGSSDDSLQGMGTTFVGLAFAGSRMFIVNVGDSRAYRIRNGDISQLTSDHTLVRELLRTGAISAEQAENHPVAHMLTRSLGPTPEVEVDCVLCPDGPARHDVYLLCSDGLYNLVQDQEMLAIVQENSLDEAVQCLIDLANDRGGTDNITVILIEVGEEYPVGLDAFPEKSDFDYDYMAPQSLDDNSQLNDEIVTRNPSLSVRASRQSSAFRNAVTSEGTGAALSERTTRSRGGSQSERETERISFPFRSTKPFNGVKVFGLLVVGVMIGILGARYFVSEPSTDLTTTVAAYPFATEVANSPINIEKSLASVAPPELGFPNHITDNPRADIEKPDNSSGEGRAGSEVSKDRNGYDDSILQRRATVEEHLSEITEKLAAFERPFGSELVGRLKGIEADEMALRSEVENLRSSLDTETRRLSLFFGRKQRLQNTDPVDLASEVAVSSTAVREKKEAFERATWAYLKEVEVWKFNPSDEQLTRSVSRLGRARAQRLRELSSEVKKAIDDNIARAEHEIASLTAKRDKAQAELSKRVREREFIKLLTGSNQNLKNRKRAELERERQLVELELKELYRVSSGTNTDLNNLVEELEN